tara:strand:+ start:2018 stop:4198 length:2181 start_codon:yes stop_codon:yes gene_type:complete
MPTKRETFPIEFRGGLITNMSPLQQGINMPGSARVLRNYEPSIEGGYRRIEGYKKYDTDIIPPYGAPVVRGASQTGTSLNLANIRQTPVAGDTLRVTHATASVNGATTSTTAVVLDGNSGTIAVGMTVTGQGISGTVTVATVTNQNNIVLSTAQSLDNNTELTFTHVYTIASGAVTFDGAANTANVTLTSGLLASPLNGATVKFESTSSTYLTLGCAVFLDDVIVAKNQSIYKTSGTGYSLVNVPAYGTVLVNGASQTGTTLDIDGLSSTPQGGDVFKIAGVDLIYTVVSTPTVSSGGTTVTITPALASSPADDAVITFLSTSRESASKTRFARYNYSGTEKIAIVDSTNVPALYDRTTFTALNDAPSDVIGADFVVSFKSQLFFAKNNLITFTAPFTDNDFTAANGSGVISVGNNVTGLVVFRDQLIIFTESTVQKLVGNTQADFQLQPITLDIGCIDEDTIQEIGGDVMFLAPDGLRLLSATDRIGDFGLAVVSKTIQNELVNFIRDNTSFTSLVIREKSQYRILGFKSGLTQENAQGILGTQFAGQGGEDMAWGELRGIRAHVADSRFYQGTETIVFSNDDGFLYQLEDGSNNFDGKNIVTTFSTPFMPISDPRIRKTFYKMFLYTDPQGSVSFDVSLKLDFDQKDSVQPTKIDFNNQTGQVAFMGQATYGSTAVYSTKLKTLFETQLIGTGFVVSLQFTSDSSDPPFSLDAITLEYGTNTRR